MKTTPPGELRTKLVLQTLTVAVNAIGQPIQTWTDAGEVWAKVSPLSAREAWWANQVNSSVSHQVTARYDARIVPTARFKISGTDRILQIDGVCDLDERHVYMVVSCIEQKDES